MFGPLFDVYVRMEVTIGKSLPAATNKRNKKCFKNMRKKFRGNEKWVIVIYFENSADRLHYQ